MDQITTYKNFVNGRFLNEGLRMTAGIILPAFIASAFGLLQTGILISLGALCGSIADTPGPVHYRRNGMFFSNILISLVAIIIGYASHFPFLLAILIFIFGFIFSMLSIYGARISAIGIAALIIMVLNLETKRTGLDVLWYALYIFAGATWYMFFSLALYSLRPYRIIQQTLGDFIIHTGTYLQGRGDFYKPNPDIDKITNNLMEQQVKLLEEQTLVSDLLFKTREFTRESSVMSRGLLKMYVDVAEMFESIITSFQDYHLLHQQFDYTGILPMIHQQIDKLAMELKHIGIEVKSGSPAMPVTTYLEGLDELVDKFEGLRKHDMNENNLEHYVGLGAIIRNLRILTQKVTDLQYYTRFDKKAKKVKDAEEVNYSAEQKNELFLFFNNFNISSNIFRHSLRVAIALLMGYLISLYFTIGHSYWILLTIVVILKPAYSLTKQRNKARIAGTFLGLMLGFVLVYFIRNDTALLFLLVLLMILTYTFLRTHYFISVLFLTPYLVLFYYFLHPVNLLNLMADRFIDTAIGSVIAYLCSLFLLPLWEQDSILRVLSKMNRAATHYFKIIADGFNNRMPDNKAIKVARKANFTALANGSGAFNRMLSEPKRYQAGIKEIHRYVALNQLLSSHLASLSYFLYNNSEYFKPVDLEPSAKLILDELNNAYYHLEHTPGLVVDTDQAVLNPVFTHSNKILKKRKEEVSIGILETETKKELVATKSITDQFIFIYSLVKDMTKVSKRLATFVS